jgi:hypothetical protein
MVNIIVLFAHVEVEDIELAFEVEVKVELVSEVEMEVAEEVEDTDDVELPLIDELMDVAFELADEAVEERLVEYTEAQAC